MAQLDGQVAIVTGAAGGIGRAYARALVEAGAKVVLADVAIAGARQVESELREDGFEALAVEVDVTDDDSVAAMGASTLAAFGRIDVLVNNAAMMAEVASSSGVGTVLEIPLDLWTRVLDVNITGPLRCVRAVVPSMRERGYGKIINQASGGAFKPSGVYGVSKLGLVSLTATLAHQLAKDGIRVNAIAPGFVNTDAGRRSASPEARAMQERTVPFPFGEAEDLTGALIFLASSASDWVTGQTISVDGGWITRL